MATPSKSSIPLRSGFVLCGLLSTYSGLGHASAATSPVDTLRIVGALPGGFNQAQQNLAGLMFVRARNEIGGTPDGLSDPWPCVEGTESGAFIPNSLQAYKNFKAGVFKQGYKLDREVAQENGDQQAFLLSKGGAVLLGMWAKGAGGDRSTLVLCQRAVNWKAAPPPPVPVTAPAVKGNVLTGSNLKWPGGARDLAVFTRVPDEESEDGGRSIVVARGQIGGDGKFRLPLPSGKDMPRGALLLVTGALLGEDSLDCLPGGNLKVSPVGALAFATDELSVLKTVSKGVTDPQKLRGMVDYSLQNQGWTPQRGVDWSKVSLIYVDRPVTVTGELNCDGDLTKVNVKLPVGWSYVLTTDVIGDQAGAVSTRTIQNAYDKYLDLWVRWEE